MKKRKKNNIIKNISLIPLIIFVKYQNLFISYYSTVT